MCQAGCASLGRNGEKYLAPCLQYKPVLHLDRSGSCSVCSAGSPEHGGCSERHRTASPGFPRSETTHVGRITWATQPVSLHCCAPVSKTDSRILCHHPALFPGLTSPKLTHPGPPRPLLPRWCGAHWGVSRVCQVSGEPKSTLTHSRSISPLNTYSKSDFP